MKIAVKTPSTTLETRSDKGSYRDQLIALVMKRG